MSARGEVRCRLCPRNCGAIRREETGDGACGMGTRPALARAAPHLHEEPCIGGERGTGALFFSGCPLHCAYCQNHAIAEGRFGRTVDARGLRRAADALVAQGARSLSLITAGHFLPAIREAFDSPPPVPVVWNTGGYETVEAIRSLQGIAGVYLPDYKYDDEAGAATYSNAPDYPAVARRAIREMLRQRPAVRLNGEGIMESGVMIRHLVLPGRAAQSMAALDRIAGEFGGAWLSLMAQYTPTGGLPKPLDRRVTRREYGRVVDHLFKLGLTEGYVQELSSASEAYRPAFDLTGVGD